MLEGQYTPTMSMTLAYPDFQFTTPEDLRSHALLSIIRVDTAS